MMDVEKITREILAWGEPKFFDPYIIVPTFSVYPSNSAVKVFVEGGRDNFVVSDGGGALQTLLGAGYMGNSGVKLIQDFLRGMERKVDHDGWIYVSGVTLNELTSAIAIVAQVSRETADMLLRKFKPSKNFDFRHDLDLKLERIYHGNLKKKGHFVGNSNKEHTFDYLIRENDNKIMIIDAVVPDAASLNAAVVSHIDVRAAKRPNVRQFIVYDQGQDWRASDVALLTLGAPAVSFQNLDSLFGISAE